jgi:hypothetical protein
MYKTMHVCLFLALLYAVSIQCIHKKSSSFRPGQVWLDTDGIPINAHGGGMLYHDGVYYWFGEHKIEGEAGNVAHVGVRCYSSIDLYNWKNEGVALAVSDDPHSEITRGCVLERPKVIYNAATQKFVMWFHLELKGTGYRSARSGVAVSDKVTGPYTFIESVRPDAGFWPVNVTDQDKIMTAVMDSSTYTGGELPGPADSLRLYARDFQQGQMARDMTLFVDDDGKAYHIFASEENSTLHISQLTDDYLSSAGTYVRVFAGRFMEAPAVFKRHGKYYFIGSGCTGWAPNAARSAVAESILGPWQELGNPCIGTDAELTFHSQSTYILPVAGKKDAFIFMADQWNPQNAIDGRYVWLPILFENDKPVLQWQDEWDLSAFAK